MKKSDHAGVLALLLCAAAMPATSYAVSAADPPDAAGPADALDLPDAGGHVDPDASTGGAVIDRLRAERREAFNPYVITAHKHTYLMPLSVTSRVNDDVYDEIGLPLGDLLNPIEVKFQLSMKVQLNEKDLLLADDGLFLGFTLGAWWQLYADDVSSPFRETNYQPEIFYVKPLAWGPFGGSTAFVVGFEHQSNGQSQLFSRSWNRLYAALAYERGNFVASIRPWYRLPEDAKETPLDPEGDDNPDILDFMGNAETFVGYRSETREYGLSVHGNPGTGKGGARLGMTFPLTGRFRGFVEYFNGYGDSLIDYDHFQQRLGLGIALTNLF